MVFLKTCRNIRAMRAESPDCAEELYTSQNPHITSPTDQPVLMGRTVGGQRTIPILFTE
jgi:hypothetical protein